MGTEIELEVDGLCLDSSKNSIGIDHGMLFQEKDRQRIRNDQIDYDYFAETGEDPGAMEAAFCKPLAEVIPRLELLGFTLDKIEREYLARSEVWREEHLSFAYGDEGPAPDLMSFEEFCIFATAHPVKALDDTFISGFAEKSKAMVIGRFSDEAVTRRIPFLYPPYEWNAYSERSYFANLIGILHPYSVLRVLAENTTNLNANVIWQYGPLVRNHWATEGEFRPGARRTKTFLIATEGSSDVHILERAILLLRPEIADFFRFIDVSNGHPFSGTGSLVKFAEGLAKIDVHNQIVFLFDNDAEGFDAYQRLMKFTLPSNMGAIMLPELEQFRAFPAKGPEGVLNTDINRRAAAIECYLDLGRSNYPPAQVVWTNYKKELDLYQGALEYKDGYMKTFLKQTAKTIQAGNYDVSKLRVVLDTLVTECCRIAEVGRVI